MDDEAIDVGDEEEEAEEAEERDVDATSDGFLASDDVEKVKQRRKKATDPSKYVQTFTHHSLFRSVNLDSYDEPKGYRSRLDQVIDNYAQKSEVAEEDEFLSSVAAPVKSGPRYRVIILLFFVVYQYFRFFFC